MFGTLITRRQKQRPLGEDNFAFDSTTFTLSTAVPRPSERRGDDRMMAMLRVAKICEASGREQLIRVRNVSAGGLMAEVGHALRVGDLVSIELSSQKVPSSVVWIRDGTAGFKFEQNIDLGELLAVASRATVFARGRRGSRSIAKPTSSSRRPITRSISTTSHWAG